MKATFQEIKFKVHPIKTWIYGLTSQVPNSARKTVLLNISEQLCHWTANSWLAVKPFLLALASLKASLSISKGLFNISFSGPLPLFPGRPGGLWKWHLFKPCLQQPLNAQLNSKLICFSGTLKNDLPYYQVPEEKDQHINWDLGLRPEPKPTRMVQARLQGTIAWTK